VLSLVWRGARRWVTHVMAEDEWIQLYHRRMIVEQRHGRLTRDLARQRRDVTYSSRHRRR
jgi:hypothetical protein